MRGRPPVEEMLDDYRFLVLEVSKDYGKAQWARDVAEEAVANALTEAYQRGIAKAREEGRIRRRRIVQAWLDRGPNPRHHRRSQDKVRRLMPKLAEALDEEAGW